MFAVRGITVIKSVEGETFFHSHIISFFKAKTESCLKKKVKQKKKKKKIAGQEKDIFFLIYSDTRLSLQARWLLVLPFSNLQKPF